MAGITSGSNCQEEQRQSQAEAQAEREGRALLDLLTDYDQLVVILVDGGLLVFDERHSLLCVPPDESAGFLSELQARGRTALFASTKEHE